MILVLAAIHEVKAQELVAHVLITHSMIEIDGVEKSVHLQRLRLMGRVTETCRDWLVNFPLICFTWVYGGLLRPLLDLDLDLDIHFFEQFADRYFGYHSCEF